MEPVLQYASCNEDTQSELAALEVRGRRVLSIAAAGERAFALLLDDPSEVTAIDINPAQVYLGELKASAMRALSWDDYLSFVGVREDGRRATTYRQLTSDLSPEARHYWDQHIEEIETGILWNGRTERGLARVSWILRLALGGTVAKLRGAGSLTAQGRLAQHLLARPMARAVLRLVFNPISGRLLLRDRVYYGDARRFGAEYILERLLTTLQHHRLDDCFIFDLFLHGHFKEERALPLALEAQSYALIKQRLERIRFVTEDIRSYLAKQPAASFDAFSLSDLGGYLSVSEFSQLLNEVQRVAAPGATVCIREFISQPTQDAQWPVSLVRDLSMEQRLDQSDRSVGCTFVCAAKAVSELGHDPTA
jgi:S-adenosylmethionine-diacylglycerol 3-amino-3-carboxypropyl transferase